MEIVQLDHPYFEDVCCLNGSLLVRSKATGMHFLIACEDFGSGSCAVTGYACTPQGERFKTGPEARVLGTDVYELGDRLHALR